MSKYYALKGEQTEINGVPEIISIIPLGHVKSRKGDFEVDEESYQLMKSHMEERGIDIVIDYEHQTLEDVQAPAGGWIKELYLEAGAISAKVEWTDRAKEYLKNKEYRYLSPVIMVRKNDNKATMLHSAALTNTPAIDGMFPIINSIDLEDYEEDEGGKKMDLKELAKLLGLPEDATEEQIFEKMKETIGEVEQLKQEVGKKEDAAANTTEGEVVANKVILSLLSLKEDAKTEDVAAAIVSLKNATGVSEAEFKALKDKIEKEDAERTVLTALKAGKISSAQKEWAMEYALKDPAGFHKFIEKAPQAVPMGEINFEPETNKQIGFDEATLKVCKMLGVSEGDLEKYGKGTE